jgi:NhaP-type Na+/H+ or K+/H+ antiporter
MWLILLLFIYLLLTAFLLAVGGGIGYLLHWLVPRLDLTVSVLTGVVASGISLHLIIKILLSVPTVEDQDIELINESSLNRLVRTQLTLAPFPTKPKRRRRNPGV